MRNQHGNTAAQAEGWQRSRAAALQTAESLGAAAEVVEQLLALTGASSAPCLAALTELLGIRVQLRPAAPLTLRRQRLQINDDADHAPQLARGIARHLARCGYRVDEAALAVVLIERCELEPRAAAEHRAMQAALAETAWERAA